MKRMQSSRKNGGLSYGTSPTDTMSPQSYNMTIGIILLYGFIVNTIMVKYCAPFFSAWNPIVLIVAYVVCCILGIVMSISSDSPLISFIGYNLVVVPIGMVLSLGLEKVKASSVLHAVLVTAFVTAGMMIMAGIWPTFFLKLGRVLFYALLLVVIVEIICCFAGVYMPTIWDALVAAIFAGYIGYDWAKAQHVPRTLDNAVDSCVDLYLDIVNLFIRLLDLMSDSDD